MSKTFRWIIGATVLVVTGLIIFIVALCISGWDFSKISMVTYENNVYEIEEDFNDISLKTSTADIVFASSSDEKIKVVCYEQQKAKHSVSVKNGTLEINEINQKAWYDYISFDFRSPKITVCLPKDKYNALTIKDSTGDIEISKELTLKSVDISLTTGDVKCYASVTDFIKITMTTGDVTLQNATAGEITVSVTTGNVNISSVTCMGSVSVSIVTGKVYFTDLFSCKSITLTGTTGDAILNGVVVTEKMSIERSTGSVRLEKCDANEISVRTTTGDITGSILSSKVFFANTNTGRKSVPSTTTGGKCELTTTTGDIIISLV